MGRDFFRIMKLMGFQCFFALEIMELEKLPFHSQNVGLAE